MAKQTILKPTRHSVHHIIATCCVALLVIAEGSCTSKKELTETSGRALIREYIQAQKQSFTVPLAEILRPMHHTLVDYTSPSSGGRGLDATLKRLVDRKFVVQHSQAVTYPDVSGHFIGKGNGNNVTNQYDLVMTPNSNAITGTVAQGVTAVSYDHHHLTGAVQPNGTVSWVMDCCGYFESHWRYNEDGGKAYLQSVGDFSSPPAGYRLTGTATGRRVELRWYEYTFSPEFQKLIVGEGQQAYVPAGSFEIGQVSGLRLLSDTEATAEFVWHPSMSNVGRALLGDGANPTGMGTATFAKKPDGTWFVDNIHY